MISAIVDINLAHIFIGVIILICVAYMVKKELYSFYVAVSFGFLDCILLWV
jgi:hypothetical protein